MENWHLMETPDVFKTLDTHLESGITDAEVVRRQGVYGRNELIDRGTKSPWKILWEQLTGIMVIVLIVSAGISIALKETTDAIVILIIVVLNAVLGFTQEYQAEKAMAALKKMAQPKAKVRRNGKLIHVESWELVPGDVIVLEAGDSVPADCRLVEVSNLRVQEAVLTGESEPVEKHVHGLTGDNIGIGDRRNMVYMGTVTTYGRGVAVVAETGMKTELGKIATMIQSVDQEQTPLQKRLDQLGKGLSLAALGIVVIVFAIGVIQKQDWLLMFRTAISMAVAAVPEGLPAVVTIALALGAQRMLKRRALIRKLPAVETLGSVTVICSDKTGTLTENRMTVTVLDVAGNHVDFQEELRSNSPSMDADDVQRMPLLGRSTNTLLLLGGALCNDAVLEENPNEPGSFSAVGDPTEGALVIAAAQTGLFKAKLEKLLPRVEELPFDSDRKRMTTIHQLHAGEIPPVLENVKDALRPVLGDAPYLSITKGSVDGLVALSTHVWVNDHIEVLDNTWEKRILDGNNELAQKGIRVLGVAFRTRTTTDTNTSADPLESGLIFVGMFGMIDPARPEVKDAVNVARGAGVRPIMITGDHPLTAATIAQQLGISNNRDVITGAELNDMSVEKLSERLDTVSVFARVSPEHKLKIVDALQKKGHVVAMTGDGVNDAPALKKADIGVAMGITGTDVSKEAADMVLLDDNFATIVAAIEEGRRIYDNVKKFIRYMVTSNAGEIWVMLLAPLANMTLPLTPLQILWINLVTDGLPGLALTVEPSEKASMRRPPVDPRKNIFADGIGRDIIWVGLLIGFVSLLSGYIFHQTGDPSWQTMIFTTLTLAQMANAMAVRSQSQSLFKVGLLSNKLLLGAVVLTIVLQLMVIYVPFFQNVFGTVALTVGQLAISLGLSLVVFFAIELSKWIFRKFAK